jgi:membrane-bound ClpP family serine protease
MSDIRRGKRGQLMGGLVLVTLGALLLLHRLVILNFYTTSWPLLLIVIGLGLFLINRRTWAGWVIGGIGVILFVVNFVIVFFPGVEAWSDLVGPIILVIIGILLLYRYSHSGFQPKP